LVKERAGKAANESGLRRRDIYARDGRGIRDGPQGIPTSQDE
jgi:hypothetical protein